MSECTHNCHTCSSGCGTVDGQKPRDVLNELREFVEKSEAKEMVEMFERIAADMEKELQV